MGCSLSVIVDKLLYLQLQALAALRVGEQDPILKEVVLNSKSGFLVTLHYYKALYGIKSNALDFMISSVRLQGRAEALTQERGLTPLALLSGSDEIVVAKL